MCGILGYIGVSKHPALSYKLAGRLFERLEIRGYDASGFYGAEGDTIHYHKQPLKSSLYVKTDPWRKLQDKNCQMLIMHARGASQGSPNDNINNHPFLNHDQTLGFIHNGRVTDAEYKALVQKYKVESECDSEVLMRIIIGSDPEKAVAKFPNEPPDIASRLMGLKDMFSFINHGHIAAAIAENIPEEKRLWLFRNKHRPLWVADVRDSLGQVWFCSTPDIWTSGINSIQELRKLPGFTRHKLYELAPKDVWAFILRGENIRYRRFSVTQDQRIRIEKNANVSPVKKSEFRDAVDRMREVLDKIEYEYDQIEREHSMTPQGYIEFVSRLCNIEQDLRTVGIELER